MLSFLRFLAPCFLIFLGSCGEMVVKSPASRKAVAAADQSWSAFQQALERGDVGKVASMIEFPLPNDLERLEEFEGIGSRKTFNRYFDTLFPEGGIRALLDYTPTAAEIRSGEWSVHHNEKTGVDTDSSVIFGFKCSRDGKVRLTSVTFAG